MKIQPYQRRVVEPDTAGGVLRQGAGTPEEGAARGLGVLAQATGELAQATGELAQRAQDARRNTEVAKRTFGLRNTYSQWFAERSRDPARYETLDTEAQQVLEKLGEQALKDVTDPLAQAALSQEVLQFSGEQLLVARQTKHKQLVDWSRGELEEQLWFRRQELANAAPEDKPRLMQQTSDILLGAAAAGYISPLDAEKKLRAFADGTVEDELGLRVYNDPEGVLEDIYAGKYSALSVDTRQRITINAEKRAEALRSQALAEERRARAGDERALTRVQEMNFGTYYSFVRRGQVTGPALYEALQNREIDGTQFRILYDAAEAIEQAGGPGNPAKAATLTQQAYRGELSVGDILQASQGGDALNRDEVDRLLELQEKGAVATNTRGYKEAVKLLGATLGVVPGDKYGGGERTNAVAGLALQELYQRAVADPNAAPQRLAIEIIERFQGSKTIAADLQDAPTARFQSLDDAKAALRNRDITVEEFNVEAEIWRSRGKMQVAP